MTAKLYTSSTDLITLEIIPAMETDPELAGKDSAELRKLAESAFAELRSRGLVVWEDGYDERDEVFYLNNEGFRLNLDENVEGADFWDVILYVVEPPMPAPAINDAPTAYTAQAILGRALVEIRALAKAAPEVISTGDPAEPLECPVCRQRSDEWVEMDGAERLNYGEASLLDGGPVLSINQSDPEFETYAYACGSCLALVTMPPHIVDITWG